MLSSSNPYVHDLNWLEMGVEVGFHQPINDDEDVFHLMNDKESLQAGQKCNYLSSKFCIKKEGIYNRLTSNECFCIILSQ